MKRNRKDAHSPEPETRFVPKTGVTLEEYKRMGGLPVRETGKKDSEESAAKTEEGSSPQDRLPEPADGVGLTLDEMADRALGLDD